MLLYFLIYLIFSVVGYSNDAINDDVDKVYYDVYVVNSKLNVFNILNTEKSSVKKSSFSFKLNSKLYQWLPYNERFDYLKYNVCFQERVPIKGVVQNTLSKYNLYFDIESNLENVFLKIPSKKEFVDFIDYQICGYVDLENIDDVFIRGSFDYVECVKDQCTIKNHILNVEKIDRNIVVVDLQAQESKKQLKEQEGEVETTEEVEGVEQRRMVEQRSGALNTINDVKTINDIKEGKVKEKYITGDKLEDNSNKTHNIFDVSHYHYLVQVVYYCIIGILIGIIMNFMPCTLPILSLKMAYLVQNTKKNTVIYFIISILLTFLGLGVIYIVCKYYNQVFYFGELLQNQFILIAIVLFLIYLLYQHQGIDVFYGVLDGFKITRVFGSGIVSVILGSTCTTPFLSTVMIFLLDADYIVSLLVFVSVGVGFCIPYVLFYIYYHKYELYINYIKKYMDTFNNIIYYLILFTILWLMYILIFILDDFLLRLLMLGIVIYAIFITSVVKSRGNMNHIFAFFAFLFVWFLIDFLIEYYFPTILNLNFNIFYFLLLLLFIVVVVANFDLFYIIYSLLGVKALCVVYYLSFNHLNQWEKMQNNYQKLSVDYIQAIPRYVEENKNVMVYFTAKWCLTCKINDIWYNKVINDQYYFADKKPVYIIHLDITKKHNNIVNYMKENNIDSIPRILIYNKKYPQGKQLTIVTDESVLLEYLI